MNYANHEGGRTNAQPETEPIREFKGVWIPASLWKRRDLTWLQKCILAEIDSLSKGCFASNAYLAKHMGIPQRTLTNNLAEIRKKGLLIDWGFNGRFRQISVADEVSSDPQHTRNRVGSIPANGYSDPPEAGTIETSVEQSRDTNQSKESLARKRGGRFRDKWELLKEVQLPKNAPTDRELAEILSRFPILRERCPDLFMRLKFEKFHLWKNNRWVPIKSLPVLLGRLQEKVIRASKLKAH